MNQKNRKAKLNAMAYVDCGWSRPAAKAGWSDWRGEQGPAHPANILDYRFWDRKDMVRAHADVAFWRFSDQPRWLSMSAP
jgi:hypothetical protein